MSRYSKTEDYLIRLGKEKMTDLFHKWFFDHGRASTYGIDEKDLYSEIGSEIGMATARQILWAVGYYIQRVIDPETGECYKLVLSKNFIKDRPWKEIYDARYRTNK